MIYSTAIGLTLGGSSTVVLFKYSFTHNSFYIHAGKNKESM
jgi:hypothetical protein